MCIALPSETWNTRAKNTVSLTAQDQPQSPRSTTKKCSVVRYEVEENGTAVTLVDMVNGIVRINGVDYTEQISALLN